MHLITKTKTKTWKHMQKSSKNNKREQWMVNYKCSDGAIMSVAWIRKCLWLQWHWLWHWPLFDVNYILCNVIWETKVAQR